MVFDNFCTSSNQHTIMLVSEEYHLGPLLESQLLLPQGLNEPVPHQLPGEQSFQAKQHHSSHFDTLNFDQDTLESSDTPLTANQSPTLHPTHSEQHSSARSIRTTCNKWMERLVCFSFQETELEHSVAEFEAGQRMYLQQMRVAYSHFLLRDRRLSQQQLEQLKALLYVPNCGESLVRWGNEKYSSKMTVQMALERLGYIEKTREGSCSKERCREEARLFCYFLLLLVLVRLMA